MADNPKALGRGLSALLGSSAEGRFQSEKLYRVPVDLISPDPNQPRKEMDEKALASLVESVRAHGVLQPLLLRAEGEGFRIVAGERRWRAARESGLREVPARIMEASEDALREISLIENIQREDLSPLEIAAAIQALMHLFSLTQEEVASRIGWSRAAVANCLRLQNLPDKVREMLSQACISEGHARALLSLKSESDIVDFARRAADGGMTVRQLEEAVRVHKEGGTLRPKPKRTFRVHLPDNIREFAKERGVKLKVQKEGPVAKIVLDNVDGVDDEVLFQALDECLKRLYPKG